MINEENAQFKKRKKKQYYDIYVKLKLPTFFQVIA